MERSDGTRIPKFLDRYGEQSQPPGPSPELSFVTTSNRAAG